MVPSPSTRPREQAAGHPQRETSRPLPVLRTSDELPKSPEVPTERPTYLEEVAGTKVAGKGPDLDKVRANPSTPPAPTSQDRTTSDQMRNSRDVGPRFHGMPVQDFRACRPGISRHVGPAFQSMSVQFVRQDNHGYRGSLSARGEIDGGPSEVVHAADSRDFTAPGRGV